MTATWLSIVLGLTAALANVFGGLLIVQRHWQRSYLNYFLAFGAGFMLATATLEMIPESLHLAGDLAMLFVLGGYLFVHLFEHTIVPHFHFGEETHEDEHLDPRIAYTALFGLMSHTFFDGVAIASGFILSKWLGFVIFLAVFLHKIPEGFTVASVMLASRRSRAAAMTAALLLGVATLLGVLLMVALRAQVIYGLPLAAGVTIYVAASDLMPEVNREPGIRMALVVFLGVAMLLALKWVAHI